MANKRVLVTGGAGFIGSHIVDALLQAGLEPFVVDNFSTGRRDNLPPGVPVYEADICDDAAMARIFAEVRPGLVSHQAAQMSVSRSVREPGFDAEVNILGIVRILEHSARVGVERVTFASSGGVLYGDVHEPATEDQPLQPISPYGISKWAGEQYLRFYAREYGLQTVALRYSNVYGPRQSPHGEAGVVAIFTQRLLAGEPPVILGDGKNIRDYVYVSDVARANLLALTAGPDQSFAAVNIGTAIGTDVNRLEQQLRAVMERVLADIGSSRPLPPARRGPPRPGDLRANLISPARATQLIGWAPRTPLDSGLYATVQWFSGQALVSQT